MMLCLILCLMLFAPHPGGRLTTEYLNLLRDCLASSQRDSLSPRATTSVLLEAVSAMESLALQAQDANRQQEGQAALDAHAREAHHPLRPVNGDGGEVLLPFVALVEACDLSPGRLNSSAAARVRQLLATLNVSATSAREQARAKSGPSKSSSSSAHAQACALQARVKTLLSALSLSALSRSTSNPRNPPPVLHGKGKRARDWDDSSPPYPAKEQTSAVRVQRMSWMLPADARGKLGQNGSAHLADAEAAADGTSQHGTSHSAPGATHKASLRHLIDEQLRLV